MSANRTLSDLIKEYQTDPVSTFHKLRYHVRHHSAGTLARLNREHGSCLLRDIRARDLKAWHMAWLGPEGKKIALAHAFMAQIRTLTSFGLTLLEDEDCERLCVVLHKLKFPMCGARTERLTADQVVVIRKMARSQFRYSIALAQALQFELILRQKDVIGEYIPHAEPGVSDILTDKEKWLRGLRWEEIDADMILRHVTSKRQKILEIDLKMAPMVVEELGTEDRSVLPVSGPIIISETTGYPYHADDFRRKWRLIADMAGIPKEVRNQDSRAGGISEATDAGADLEHVRHAATHSDISQTARYSRGSKDKISNVQAMRRQHRFRQIS